MLIGVIGKKGGTGKTTLAVHLAGALAKEAPTALIDADQTNDSARVWARNGLLPFTVVGAQAQVRAFREHDHVVLDTWGGLGDEDMQELYGSVDRVVLPAKTEFLSLTTLVRAADVLREVDPELGKLRVVLTMARRGPRLEQARAELTELGLPPVQPFVRHSTAFEDATAQGVLVRDVGGRYAALCWADCLAVLKAVRA